VTKVFAADVPEELRRREIEGVKLAGGCGRSLRLLDFDVGHACYTEEFWPAEPVAAPVRGSTTGAEHDFLASEYGALSTALAELVFVAEPRRVGAGDHLRSLLADTSAWLDRARVADPESAGIVERYIAGSVALLDAGAEIVTTFSHGDCSLLNVIRNGGEWRLIDWEDARARAALTDFYSLYTTEYYYGREHAELTAWARAGLDLFLKQVARVDQQLAAELADYGSRYRAWAHLERLRMLMSRGAEQKRIAVVRRSAEVVERFDSDWPAAA
jgi:hypothetical protein